MRTSHASSPLGFFIFIRFPVPIGVAAALRPRDACIMIDVELARQSAKALEQRAVAWLQFLDRLSGPEPVAAPRPQVQPGVKGRAR